MHLKVNKISFKKINKKLLIILLSICVLLLISGLINLRNKALENKIVEISEKEYRKYDKYGLKSKVDKDAYQYIIDASDELKRKYYESFEGRDEFYVDEFLGGNSKVISYSLEVNSEFYEYMKKEINNLDSIHVYHIDIYYDNGKASYDLNYGKNRITLSYITNDNEFISLEVSNFDETIKTITYLNGKVVTVAKIDGKYYKKISPRFEKYKKELPKLKERSFKSN